VLGMLAVIHDGRNRERDDGQAEQEDEHHAHRAGQKPHTGVVLVQDRQRDEHAGKDDRKMRKNITKRSHKRVSSKLLLLRGIALSDG